MSESSTPIHATAARAWRVSRLVYRRPYVAVDAAVLSACIYFIALGNRPFWNEALAQRSWSDTSTWLFVGALSIALTLLHFLVLALVCNRWSAKPILTLLFAVNAVAVVFVQDYGVYLDPGMVRNIVNSDLPEAREYVSAGMVLSWLFYAAPPIVLLWWVRFTKTPVIKALFVRVGILVGAITVATLALVFVMRDLAPLMQAQRQLRYLITPGNYLSSSVRVALDQRASVPAARRHSLAVDRRPHPQQTRIGNAAPKPVLFVMVVGETARADNFSLNGYARQTNPQLSRLNLVNFSNVSSCGTATEVSLPCMFSPLGRDAYDEDVFRTQDGLLQVLSHAGYRVVWRDNNSGCKGACDGDGIEFSKTSALDQRLCPDNRCHDEVLLSDLENETAGVPGNRFLVLHQLGNHGPAYYQRYPQPFKRFTPTCDTADLRACSPAQIINSYDNAILYTDHLVAEIIHRLKSQASDYDTVMLYVSDHGESLGEGGVYLHGLPYSVAPHVQTHVPMILWMSEGFRQSFDVETDCVRRRAAKPASHDNVFHSVLGLLSIEAEPYLRNRDLFAGCIGRALLSTLGTSGTGDVPGLMEQQQRMGQAR